MKVAIYTLGCKVNQYDSQEIASLLRANGYDITDAKNDADIYIINSCTVTAESTRKSRQAVRRFKNEHPSATIILTGCFPQAFADEAETLREADIIIGNRSNPEIPAILASFLETKQKYIKITPHNKNDKYNGCNIDSFEGHTRAFIKIQDGCNRYCSYCTIPKARGFSRSRDPKDIKEEITKLSKLGYKEIVFVGINLSSYGLDCGLNICDALKIAENTDGIERIRLGSLEPDHITDDVISELAEMKKFCPQFHLSLQSGSNRILKKMNRHYTAEEYLTLCEKLRNTFPDISLTTDIIVGFPGETDEDFTATIEFAKKCRFMKVHVFPFSPREGTPAFSHSGKISNTIKNTRCSILQKECDIIRQDILNSYSKKIVDVLFESPKDGYFQGYTKNYTPVCIKTPQNLTGMIRSVTITDTDGDKCFGELI